MACIWLCRTFPSWAATIFGLSSAIASLVWILSRQAQKQSSPSLTTVRVQAEEDRGYSLRPCTFWCFWLPCSEGGETAVGHSQFDELTFGFFWSPEP